MILSKSFTLKAETATMLTQRQIFLQHLAQTNDIPLALEIEKAEGLYLYDTGGRKYMDLISGISVSALGHRNARVITAVQEQLDKYMHLMVYGEYIQAPQVKLAALLTTQLPEALNCVYFTNSGTEATEGAMKLAKRLSGRTEFISCLNAYHGSSQGALSLAGGEWFKNSFRPLLPGIRQIRYNEPADLKEITTDTAAVFIEPLQAEAGCLLPTKEYMQQLRKRCTETGTLLVFDEIQTAFGRTGTLWAFEQYAVVPDILLSGKALGGGMPLGAFISSYDNMQALTHDPVLGHITTFGGHPISCVAAYAALEVLLEEKLIDEVYKKEALFRELLVHKNFRALHGKGLLLALELNDFEAVQKLIRHCSANGIITDWFLFNDRCIRIAPPLIISEEEIKNACAVILQGATGL